MRNSLGWKNLFWVEEENFGTFKMRLINEDFIRLLIVIKSKVKAWRILLTFLSKTFFSWKSLNQFEFPIKYRFIFIATNWIKVIVYRRFASDASDELWLIEKGIKKRSIETKAWFEGRKHKNYAPLSLSNFMCFFYGRSKKTFFLLEN